MKNEKQSGAILSVSCAIQVFLFFILV